MLTQKKISESPRKENIKVYIYIKKKKKKGKCMVCTYSNIK